MSLDGASSLIEGERGGGGVDPIPPCACTRN